MAENTLDQVERLVDQLSPQEQARLLASLALRMAQLDDREAFARSMGGTFRDRFETLPLRPDPLNAWSDVTLVVWDVPETVSLSEAYDAIYRSSEDTEDTCISDLRKWEFTTRSQRQEIEHESMDV